MKLIEIIITLKKQKTYLLRLKIHFLSFKISIIFIYNIYNIYNNNILSKTSIFLVILLFAPWTHSILCLKNARSRTYIREKGKTKWCNKGSLSRRGKFMYFAVMQRATICVEFRSVCQFVGFQDLGQLDSCEKANSRLGLNRPFV